MKLQNVGIVIILYYPDTDLLLSNINRLREQAGCIYLVDNTPGECNKVLFELSAEFTDLIYIPLMVNRGIAEAQNIGIVNVFEDPSKGYVFLLDQDSEPDGTIIQLLLSSYDELVEKCSKIKIAAIGPNPINRESNRVYKDRVLSNHYIGENLVQKPEIMSSGSLISRMAIDDIGLMESSLFIDGVDSEWCWRGAQKGYLSFINKHAVLIHKLGSGDTKFLGFQFATPPPIRCYYQYRNFLTLIRRPYVPLGWKLLNLMKYLVKFFYYPLFLPNKKLYLTNMIKGIKEGVRYKDRNRRN